MALMLPFIAAMAISMSIIPVMVRLAPRLGMLDAPDPRKVHATPIPRVGGIGIVLGALIPLALWLPVDKALASYFIGSAVLLLFGVWDDIRELGHYPKFLGQFLAVIVVVYYGNVYV
ncbi:MAG: undecaprenyl/decaprenyl-phosphate alpha-N-acetylglucosaminyl 1-phosphate transferase, partial [Gammaproteobacteria bacterium]